MKELSDQEIWKIIVDNRKLFYHFCKKRRLPYEFFDDLVTETQLLVFKRIKAGDLEKGSLSHIINFAVKRTSYKLYGDVVSSAKIPSTVYSQIGDIYLILLEKNKSEAIETIRDMYFPRMSLIDMTIVINSMYKLDQKVIKRNDDDEKDPYNNWIENFVASDTPLPEDSIYVDIISIIKKHEDEFTGSCEHSIYTIGRRYGLEKQLSEIYPDMFVNVKSTRSNVSPSYNQIGAELGISANSARNHEMRGIDKLRGFVKESML